MRFLILMMIISLEALAIEPQNPVTLCDRFLVGPPKEDCEKKMKNWNPDWYLATVCNETFSDTSFYECVQYSKLGSYSPQKLETCSGDGLTDIDRLSCVKSARADRAEAYQQAKPQPKKHQRLPASASKKKKK
jgi:hypothetical protein